MSENLERYRDFERRLAWMRWINAGLETPQEERLTDEMERLWWQLSATERQVLNGEVVSTLTSPPPVLTERETNDADVWTTPGISVRQLVERAV